MVESSEYTLGKLIFNGAILFLSISFGLFNLAIGIGRLSISSIFQFSFLLTLVILLGIASMSISFFGIKNKNINYIYIAGICLLLVVGIIAFIYVQIFIKTLETQVTLIVNNATV